MNAQIRHIFFDVGDTLRVTEKIADHRLAAKQRVAALLGTDMDPEAFADLIDERYEGYRNWATNSWIESSEEELWLKWLAPDFPPERVKPIAVELTYLFRQFRGKRVLAEHVMEVVETLTRRGYKLGIISNVITSRELPEWIEEDGLTAYFSPVVLSSLTGIRKPDPRIFEIALKQADIGPEHCAYIGDNVERDIGGANAVGFGRKILIDMKGTADAADFTPETTPDDIITSALDLLELFPA